MFMELRKLYRVHNFSYKVTCPIYALNKIRINEIIGTVKEIAKNDTTRTKQIDR